ncbi:MAG: hypothetical protein RLZZ200_568 [Pseudomonadota bacterium]|jgi:uncharacterized alpha-E superfamily protein
MLSRAAENLYWMARYLERAENTARLINATGQVQLDLPRGARFGWDSLLQIVGLDPQFKEAYAESNESNVMDFLIASPRNPGSIHSCIRYARENCRVMRDVLPRELWERVNTMYLALLRQSEAHRERVTRRRLLEDLIRDKQSATGLLSDCMSHDVAYQFLSLGEYIERADMTTRILDINTAVLLPAGSGDDEDAVTSLLWVAVLKSLSAFQMYRRHGAHRVNGDDVVSFLVTNHHFPRSVVFCLDDIEGRLANLPHNVVPLRALRTARRRVDSLEPSDLAPLKRHETFDRMQEDLARIHDAVAAEYFHLHNDEKTEPMCPST